MAAQSARIAVFRFTPAARIAGTQRAITANPSRIVLARGSTYGSRGIAGPTAQLLRLPRLESGSATPSGAVV